MDKDIKEDSSKSSSSVRTHYPSLVAALLQPPNQQPTDHSIAAILGLNSTSENEESVGETSDQPLDLSCRPSTNEICSNDQPLDLSCRPSIEPQCDGTTSSPLPSTRAGISFSQIREVGEQDEPLAHSSSSENRRDDEPVHLTGCSRSGMISPSVCCLSQTTQESAADAATTRICTSTLRQLLVTSEGHDREKSSNKENHMNHKPAVVRKLREFLKCHLCPFETLRQICLTRHLRDMHEKPFPCDKCDRRFGQERKLMLHKKSEHTIHLAPLRCPRCPKSFTQNYHYKQHLITHSRRGCFLICYYCNENFQHKHEIALHMDRCHSGKSVKCPQCPHVASHKYLLRQHEREVHSKSIVCGECGKRVSKKSRIITHIKNNHMQKETYTCEFCFATYTSPKWFEIHVKTCAGAAAISNLDSVDVRGQ